MRACVRAERGEEHPAVAAGAVVRVDQGRDGSRGEPTSSERAALQVLVPGRSWQQRLLRLLDVVGEAEQDGHAERRRRVLRQPALQLLRHHHGMHARHGNNLTQ